MTKRKTEPKKPVPQEAVPDRMAILEGSPLQKWRNEKNLTLDDIATTIGVSREAVRTWELGMNVPRNRALLALATFMDVPPGDIFRQLVDWQRSRKGAANVRQ